MESTVLHIDAEKGPRKYTQKEVSIDILRLDPGNVRFLHLKDPMNEKQIEEYIWKEPDTKTLFKQITSSGGLSEPPYIMSNYVVKEGNRRIVCMRKANALQKKGELDSKLPPDIFEKVIVNVLDDNISTEEMDILLARWHVTGKKEWDALNQANHIWNMNNSRGMSFERIRDRVGMSKGQVIQKCRAYEYTIEYLKETGDLEIKKYSFFEEMYKKPEIRKWFESNPANKKRFYDWVKENRFNRTGAKDVRRLPEILQDKEALAAFEAKNAGFEEAMFILQKKNPALSSHTFKAIENAIEALHNMPRQEYESIAGKEAEVKMLKTLHREIETIFQRLKIK